MNPTYNTGKAGIPLFTQILLLALIGVSFFVFQQKKVLDELKSRIETHSEDNKELAPTMVEKIVTKTEAWRPVQERVKDTVVQVFSQVVKIDLLQPFKTPSQHAAYGSAFFINKEGDLITNAHVVNEAKSIWIQIPSLGKRIIDVEIIGLSPERDLALLRVTKEGLEVIRKELGEVPFLKMGNSDLVRRSDEVMALGYPLGQQSLKSTTGVISGREHDYIQMSAAINPGNSGGPLLDTKGEVIGINSAVVAQAQNVGYIIPINDLKHVLADLYKIKLLRKPFLGVLFNNANASLTEYLGNPQPGGCYVIEVVKNSPLAKAGVKPGDMIYEINGNRLDEYGDMSAAWSEDKFSVVDYVSRLSIGETIAMVVYRNGERKEFSVQFSQTELPAVRKIYPGYEPIDYEVVAGMVVMPLSLDHIHIMSGSVTGLSKFAELNNQTEPALVITHIFPNSQLYRSRTITVGATLNEVNGIEVKTLDELRLALKKGIGQKFLTIKAADNVARASENVFVALPYAKILQEEAMMATDYHYAMSDTVKELIQMTHPNANGIITGRETVVA